ncbi:MAG: hypothetical protein HY430_03785 [Candidatus Levybacteria bacterium]|nr:hypothetical protein [Candidatus Levybacteria bacterium]
MLIKKIATGVATAALLTTSFIPAAFADTTGEISGNGSGSTNKIIVNENCSNIVDQTNITKVKTTVHATANTGGNTASGNTGGDVTIDTGAASNAVTVTVTGGNNDATVNSCCCSTGNVDATISENGTDSYNKIKKNSSNSTLVSQYSKTKVKTKAKKLKAKTGYNKANDNTGGTVGITTDDASNTVDVTVDAGHNTLNP